MAIHVTILGLGSPDIGEQNANLCIDNEGCEAKAGVWTFGLNDCVAANSWGKDAWGGVFDRYLTEGCMVNIGDALIPEEGLLGD